SPCPMPCTASAISRPAVAEETATASMPLPTKSAKFRSNSAERLPVVSHPDRRQSTTAATSASPMSGSEKGRGSNVIIAPTAPDILEAYHYVRVLATTHALALCRVAAG